MKREKSIETILVLVLALIVFYLFKHKSYLLHAAITIGAIGLLIPYLALKIHRAWMKLAEGIGFIMSKVLLTTIFFVFLVPLSFLKRIFQSKKSIGQEGREGSYFTERNFTYNKDSLENVW